MQLLPHHLLQRLLRHDDVIRRRNTVLKRHAQPLVRPDDLAVPQLEINHARVLKRHARGLAPAEVVDKHTPVDGPETAEPVPFAV